MHQREKIQAVFESVELEKGALRQERDELKKERLAIANDRKLLKEAAQKISGVNTEGAADISHAASKIKTNKTNKTNTDNVLNKSIKAIHAVKRQKFFSSITASLITLIFAFIIGIGFAHYSYTKFIKEDVLAYEIKSIREQKSELERASAIAIKLEKEGVKIYKDAIVFPKEYNNQYVKMEDGRLAVLLRDP